MAISKRGPGSGGPRRPVDTTLELLGRIRAGDQAALERLLNRYWPRLLRWAHKRLPSRIRDLHSTEDLVTKALVKALSRLKEFVPEHPGALIAYLRTAFYSEVHDALRKANRWPAHVELDPDHVQEVPSPLDLAVGTEVRRKYETALSLLRADYQAAIILRLELQYSYAEIAGSARSHST